jgi:hypothetical protein
MSFLALMSQDELEAIFSGAQIDPSKPACGDVGFVQVALKQQGYYEGPLTGSFNDELADAMQAFLADQGMSASASNAEFCQALRTAQMELSSKARSEINSRILGVNPILLLLGAAAVAVGAIKLRGGMRANHGMTYCKRCLNPKVLGEPCEYCRRHPWFEQNGRRRRHTSHISARPVASGRIKSFKSRAEARKSIRDFERSLGRYKGKASYSFSDGDRGRATWIVFFKTSVDRKGLMKQLKRSPVKVRVE